MRRWAENGRKHVAPSIERFVFFVDFNLKISSDRFGVKRYLIERFKSYRLMCLTIKFVQKQKSYLSFNEVTASNFGTFWNPKSLK